MLTVASFCRLYLQTKLANPHYKPEIAAQTTLVNFCVTEVGLEEQLLAQVVDHERPDLQEQARSLVRQLGEYTITLKELEDNLLQRLANSQVCCTCLEFLTWQYFMESYAGQNEHCIAYCLLSVDRDHNVQSTCIIHIFQYLSCAALF